jgi:RimJ/RimL family protein N-acetyltransferase
MNPHEFYETERLILRPTTEDDAEFILRLMNTPKWYKYIGDRNVKTTEQAKEYIKTKMEPQLKRLGYANYTLITKSDDEKIGTCGLYDRNGMEGIDIGFAFLPEYEKKGYAFESAQKVKSLAFEKFGLTEISAMTTKNNISSQKLLEKLGMKLTGTIQLPEDDKKEFLLYRLKKDNS